MNQLNDYSADESYAVLQDIGEYSFEQLVQYASSIGLFRAVSVGLREYVVGNEYAWPFVYLSIAKKLENESKNSGL